MGVSKRGGTNVHSGFYDVGKTPNISNDGVRTGVEKKTAKTDSFFGPSVSQGNAEDSLTSGAELLAGKGQFPRKADTL